MSHIQEFPIYLIKGFTAYPVTDYQGRLEKHLIFDFANHMGGFVILWLNTQRFV